MADNKKSYSFLEIVPAQGKNGEYKHVTLVGWLTNIEARTTTTGKTVVSGSMPINNRTKTINSMLGTSFPESDDTIWANVSFWETTGERLKKFAGDRTKLRLLITGSIAVDNYTDKNGNARQGVKIAVSNWDPSNIGGSKSDGNNNANTSSGNGNTSNNPGANTMDDPLFSELSDEDGELPF